MMWIWFGIAVGLIILECATIELVAIWFALAALVMGVIVGFASGLELIWQIFIFVAISVIFVLATRPLVKKLMQKRKGTDTNLELIIGRKAIVTEKIENDLSVGAVKINGLVWNARSVDGSVVEKDEFVFVKEIQGNKLIVEKINPQNN